MGGGVAPVCGPILIDPNLETRTGFFGTGVGGAQEGRTVHFSVPPRGDGAINNVLTSLCLPSKGFLPSRVVFLPCRQGIGCHNKGPMRRWFAMPTPDGGAMPGMMVLSGDLGLGSRRGFSSR